MSTNSVLRTACNVALPTAVLLGLMVVSFPASARAMNANESPATEQDKDKVKNISAEKKDELNRKRKRFENQSPNQKALLREFNREIENHEDSEHLTTVMNNYTEWLRTLPGADRAELLDLPANERIERIKELKALPREDYVREAFGGNVQFESIVSIFRWVQKFVDHREAELIGHLSDRQKDLIKQNPDLTRKTIFEHFQKTEDLTDILALVSDEERKSFDAILSKEQIKVIGARWGFDGTTEDGISMFMKWDLEPFVHLWIRGLLNNRKFKVDEPSLQKFFDETLTEKSRKLLDEMSSKDRRQRLVESFVVNEKTESTLFVDLVIRGQIQRNFRGSSGGRGGPRFSPSGRNGPGGFRPPGQGGPSGRPPGQGGGRGGRGGQERNGGEPGRGVRPTRPGEQPRGNENEEGAGTRAEPQL